jgi:hypothetical protein
MNESMTDSNLVPQGGERDQQEAACQREAARIRQERKGWVVIWAPDEGRYKAYPKFRAPRGTVASASRPGELRAQMDQVELAARKPRSGPQNTDAT